MKKGIIFVVILLVLLALVIGIRLLNNKPAEAEKPAPAAADVQPAADSSAETQPQAAETVPGTASETAPETAQPAQTSDSTQGQGKSGNDPFSTGGAPQASSAPQDQQQGNTPHSDPNMTGEPVQEMEIEEEIEIKTEENTAGGLI